MTDRHVQMHAAILTAMSTLFLSTVSNASDSSYQWTHYGIRPLGMGNAFTSVADDYNAVFYNPAGLATLEDWSLELINPIVSVSKNTVTTANSVMKLASGSSTAKSGTSAVQSVLDIFSDLSGRPQHLQLGLSPHFVMQGFGLGIGLNLGGSLTVHREISADVDAGLDVIVPISAARKFRDGRVSVGASVKPVMTMGVDREFSLADITAFTKKSDSNSSGNVKLSDYVQSGQGVGVDVGVLLRSDEKSDTTLGFAVLDLGGTPYKATNNAGRPKPRPATTNFGISSKFFKSDDTHLLATMDVQNISSSSHFSKKVQFGSEFSYGKVIKLQAGLHQGEFCGGIQLDAWLLKLRFATYAEQLGPVAGDHPDFVDRRYVAQLKMFL